MGRFILNPEIKQMLVNFHRISGLRVGVHDVDLSIITDYPQQEKKFEDRKFCEKARKCSEDLYSECDKCDAMAFEYARISGTPYIYKCHMGFLEAVIPIMAGGEAFCFLMIGQVRVDGMNLQKRVSREEMMEIFRKYKIPEQKYPIEMAQNDYDSMTCMDVETFKSFVYFLELCAQKIYNDEYVRRDQMSVSKELMKFVGLNLYNDITIQDFADSVGLSTSYLSHTISREMGTTFTKYLMQCRMEEAKRILRTTDMSVKKISVLLRYNDVSYFVRQFKRITGMTCTEYRRSRTEGQKTVIAP